MKRKWLFIAATIILCPILVVLGHILLQKPFVPLLENDKIIAVAKQSFLGPVWNESSADVYVGEKKIFSLHEDFWASPEFIYPFADGKRFLCDYWDDTAWLDFIVDFGALSTNELNSSKWPLDYQLRADLARMATNVVFDTKGVVRLPNYAELQEVSSYLTGTTPKPIRAGYFKFFNFGTKTHLLLDLATNRQSCYPVIR
jgi:hypothetical protein